MPPSDKVTMTQQELKELVSEAVTETLTKLGVDVTNPVEMQRDFQHLREWRNTTSTLKRHGLITLIGIFVAGAVAAMWLGFQSYFSR